LLRLSTRAAQGDLRRFNLYLGCAMQGLILLITYRCPLECGHCITDSNPRRRGHLDVPWIIETVREAAELGVTHLGVSGGDPFSRPTVLQAISATAFELNLNLRIITSAFWATSPEKAKRILRSLRKIDILGLSLDRFHLEFQNLQNTRNAIEAALELGIPQIEVQICHTSPAEFSQFERALDIRHERLAIGSQPVFPVGRALHLDVETQRFGLPLSALSLGCPMGPPVITPKKEMLGCCSALMDLGEQNPIRFANLSEQTLQSALDVMKHDKYYNFLRVFGVGPLVDYLRARHPDAFEGKYSDVCHVCHYIHSNVELRRSLDTLIASWRA
jgi:hypothetical protein